MKIAQIKPLALPEVKVVQLQRFVDSRGYFLEVFRTDVMMNHPELPELHGKQLCQLNESRSKQNVIRGLHTQCRPNLDKLLRILQGKIIDVAVDIRPHSPTFGKAVTYQLSSSTNTEFEEIIFIPFGFAHGIVALEESHIQYIQTGFWNGEGEATIQFQDPAIDWSASDPEVIQVVQETIKRKLTSEKDLQGISLENWKNHPLASEYVLP